MDFNAALAAEKPDEVIQPPPPRPPLAMYDVATVKAQLAPYDQKIDGLVTQAKAIEVKDEASNIMAVELAGGSKKLNKAIEDARKRFTQPALDYKRAVDGLAKGYQDRLTAIETILKGKLREYQNRVEMERRKAEEAARQAAIELQKKIDAEAKAAHVEPVQVAPVVIPQVQKTTRTEQGSMSFREVWKFDVVTPAEVPRTYLMVDETRIRQAVKAGIREIPGVKIFMDKEPILRT